MNKIALSLIVAVSIVGCTDENSHEVRIANKENFSSPKEVGVLPNGQVVKRVTLERGAHHNHYIYFADGAITVNHAVPHGKSTVNQVTVMINGVEYIKKESAK